jgi:hypothetical protein
MHIFKEIFRIRMTWVFLSSELYIKDTHVNGVKFSNDDCYIIGVINKTLITNFICGSG